MVGEMENRRLEEAIELVLKHKEEMDKELYDGIHYRVLSINKGDSSMENLKRWFIIATGPGWRGGPALSLEKRKKMIASFDEWYERVVNEILPNYHGQARMDKIYEELVNIKWVGSKIATVYLRDIIYHFNIWSELRDYLYLPIDRHVRAILSNRLGENKDEVPKVSESCFTRKSRKFQKALSEIHNPRVEFDYFWYIGARFCSYYLCNFCWLKELCIKKEYLLKDDDEDR